MKFLIVLLATCKITFLCCQTPITPYSSLNFGCEDHTWSIITEDSTLFDGISYDGRHNYGHFNTNLKPIEFEDYIYTVDVHQLYGIEGSIISKLCKKTGHRVWYKTFDLRSNKFHEFPRHFHINERGELIIYSYSSLETYANTDLIYLFNQVPVSWNIKKIDIVTGEVQLDKTLNDSRITFNSNHPANFIFETTIGHSILNRSLSNTTEFYQKINLDKEFELVDIDTIYLDLPKFLNNNIYVNISRNNHGYCSLDIKLGLPQDDKPRYYNFYFWDRDFNLIDSIPQNKLYQIFNDVPSRYFIDYFDDETILIRTSKFNNGDWETKLLEIDRLGNLKRILLMPQRDVYVLYNEAEKCPIVLSNYFDLNNFYGLSMYSGCDSIQSNILCQSIPNNLFLKLVNGIILEDRQILVSTLQYKDTTFNNVKRNYFQGVVYSQFMGDKLGLSSSTFEDIANTRNKLKLYPNPSSSIIFVDSPVINAEVSIFDFNGKAVKKLKLNNNSFDISDLFKGLYIIEIKQYDHVEYHKIIKLE